jgi:hypothetical protein
VTLPSPSQVLEVGMHAILGGDKQCKRWGTRCDTHSNPFVSSHFANQSEVECGHVHWARSLSAEVISAVEPLIRADERERLCRELGLRDDRYPLFRDLVEAETREKVMQETRAKVVALPTNCLEILRGDGVGWDGEGI